MSSEAEPDSLITIQRHDSDALVIVLRGDHTLENGCAQCEDALAAINGGECSCIEYDATSLGEWDSSLLAFLFEIERTAAANGVDSDRSGLPPHLRTLLEMAMETRQAASSPRRTPRGVLENLGALWLGFKNDALEFLEFIGEVTLGLQRLITGKSRMRRRDFFVVLQSVSSNALPIVILISFLVGLIIAFLGAVVLERFGAEFAVAYLVGYGVLREMGAVMTGIIMSGRTGAAFAAQIGSMKVTEEVDALKTLGISPVDFLVMPRVLALILMMPLLTIFADVVGILGGFLVAVLMLDVPTNQFFSNINFVTGLNDLFLGVFKGGVYGVLIAISGCLRGLQCGSSADAVGVAATRAVVLSIVLIIFANAVIDWVAAFFNV